MRAAQHGVPAAFGYVRFVGESRPSSRRYPAESMRNFPGKQHRDVREPLDEPFEYNNSV